MRIPTASKNSMISFDSGAPPDPGMRSLPPKGSRTLLKTSLSARRCFDGVRAGTGSPSPSSRLTSRPIGSAQSSRRFFTPVAASKRATTAVWTFSYTRGTLGRSVGRTCGSASATRSGSARNAIVNPTCAPEEHQPAVVVREREVEEHDVVGPVVASSPSGRRRSPSRSSCGSRACSPSAGRSSRTCR